MVELFEFSSSGNVNSPSHAADRDRYLAARKRVFTVQVPCRGYELPHPSRHHHRSAFPKAPHVHSITHDTTVWVCAANRGQKVKSRDKSTSLKCEKMNWGREATVRCCMRTHSISSGLYMSGKIHDHHLLHLMPLTSPPMKRH